jgi:tRNA pseudouridine38-40 synthase
VDPADERVLRVDVYGDAFLHNMVRILIGTIADVARGRLQPGAIGRALISRDRRDAGITAPAAGLYLVQVTMVDEGTDAWPALGRRRGAGCLRSSRSRGHVAPRRRWVDG